MSEKQCHLSLGPQMKTINEYNNLAKNRENLD